MSDATHDLRRLQQWMQTVVMHPDGIAQGIASSAARQQIDIAPEQIELVIQRSQALDSLARLQIYGNAYFARLLECLREEFPAVAHAVGGETFDAFAFGYLQEYPSRSYTLHELGARFPQYLAETRPQSESSEPGWPDFLIDLATLERIYSEVFDGPGGEGQRLLQADDLQAIRPECWPEARLVPVESLRLCAFRFPVHDYASAVRHLRRAASAEATTSVPAPQTTYLAITRRDYIVRRTPVSEPQYTLLTALAAGEPIGRAIEQTLETTDVDMDALAQNLQKWFRDWSAAGYFWRVEAPESENRRSL